MLIFLSRVVRLQLQKDKDFFFITTKEYNFSRVEFELVTKGKGQLTQNKRKPCLVEVCEKIVK